MLAFLGYKVDVALTPYDAHEKVIGLSSPTTIIIATHLEDLGPQSATGENFIAVTKRRGTRHPVFFISLLSDDSESSVVKALKAGAQLTFSPNHSPELLKVSLIRACEQLRATVESTQDPLTGLPTRKVAEGRLDHDLGLLLYQSTSRERRGVVDSQNKPTPRDRRGVPDKYALVCMFFDLKDFKTINDSHGHEAGDRALQAFATILQKTLRDNDILYRHGGDEFVNVLFDVDQGRVKQIISLLRASLQEERILVDLRDPKKGYFCVSVSVGYATLSPSELQERRRHARNLTVFASETREMLCQQADEAMYRDKRKA